MPQFPGFVFATVRVEAEGGGGGQVGADLRDVIDRCEQTGVNRPLPTAGTSQDGKKEAKLSVTAYAFGRKSGSKHEAVRICV